MLRSLSIGLMATALAATTLPAKADGNGGADNLGVMSINLKNIVKPQVGVQAQTQAAGTPNEAGLGGFLPLVVGKNSVFFADVLANANFSDWGNSSSIINTTVAGTTISTSSRLGYRWLNGDRSWMYGLNAGYDTRPMNSGPADAPIVIHRYDFATQSYLGSYKAIPGRTKPFSAFFQQAAVNAEAHSEKWSFNAYALIPTGDTEQRLNWYYDGGALTTYGLNTGYNITSALRTSVGYYYQNGDLNTADGSGVLARLAYAINNGLTLGTNLSYDNAFKSRFSADIKWRFNTNGGPSVQTPKTNTAVTALTSTPSNRNVRVHDSIWADIGIGAVAVAGAACVIVSDGICGPAAEAATDEVAGSAFTDEVAAQQQASALEYHGLVGQ